MYIILVNIYQGYSEISTDKRINSFFFSFFHSFFLKITKRPKRIEDLKEYENIFNEKKKINFFSKKRSFFSSLVEKIIKSEDYDKFYVFNSGFLYKCIKEIELMLLINIFNKKVNIETAYKKGEKFCDFFIFFDNRYEKKELLFVSTEIDLEIILDAERDMGNSRGNKIDKFINFLKKRIEEKYPKHLFLLKEENCPYVFEVFQSFFNGQDPFFLVFYEYFGLKNSFDFFEKEFKLQTIYPIFSYNLEECVRTINKHQKFLTGRKKEINFLDTQKKKEEKNALREFFKKDGHGSDFYYFLNSSLEEDKKNYKHFQNFLAFFQLFTILNNQSVGKLDFPNFCKDFFSILESKKISLKKDNFITKEDETKIKEIIESSFNSKHYNHILLESFKKIAEENFLKIEYSKNIFYISLIFWGIIFFMYKNFFYVEFFFKNLIFLSRITMFFFYNFIAFFLFFFLILYLFFEENTNYLIFCLIQNKSICLFLSILNFLLKYIIFYFFYKNFKLLFSKGFRFFLCHLLCFYFLSNFIRFSLRISKILEIENLSLYMIVIYVFKAFLFLVFYIFFKIYFKVYKDFPILLRIYFFFYNLVSFFYVILLLLYVREKIREYRKERNEEKEKKEDGNIEIIEKELKIQSLKEISN